jgi:predicted N-acetyltransferase YhbS
MRKSINNKVREATKADYAETERLTRDAFWDLYKPGADEHAVLRQIRSSDCFIPQLDIVLEENGRIIGHLICSKAKIDREDKAGHDVLCVGPLCVEPSLQRMGSGSKLMKFAIEKARELGYPGMILFGSPGYYPRFGFVNAAKYGITTRDGMNFDPFMALELKEGSLGGIRGRFIE